jgi:uncharacterized RDD family membrane protein YckC
LLIDVIDLFIIGCACAVSAFVLDALFLSVTRIVLNLLLATWCALFFSYFVLLKRSRFGTLGYRLGRVRIVGLDGHPPSIGALTFRLTFVMLGPINYLDSIWLASDRHRQSLRDKLAHTYVIRRNAEPAGTGRIVYAAYEICGYNFIFCEVESQRPSPMV